MTIRWPLHVLRPQDAPLFDIAPRNLAGPASMSGVTQVASADAGLWKASLAAIIVRGRAAVLTFRAIDALLEGRVNPILVPIGRGWQPVPAGAVANGLYAEQPYSDGAPFSDDAGFVGTVIDVTLSAPAAARAVSASVTIDYADTLLPGQHFSLGERLYRLRSVTYTGATTADITFRPPLREAAASGDALNFDDPVCRMKLATDGEMNLDAALRRGARPTVSFIEDLA